jgi:hypothetical protein
MLFFFCCDYWPVDTVLRIAPAQDTYCVVLCFFLGAEFVREEPLRYLNLVNHSLASNRFVSSSSAFCIFWQVSCAKTGRVSAHSQQISASMPLSSSSLFILFLSFRRISKHYIIFLTLASRFRKKFFTPKHKSG